METGLIAWMDGWLVGVYTFVCLSLSLSLYEELSLSLSLWSVVLTDQCVMKRIYN